MKAKNRTNKLFLGILKTQPTYFLMLTVRTSFPSSPVLWDAGPVVQLHSDVEQANYRHSAFSFLCGRRTVG